MSARQSAGLCLALAAGLWAASAHAVTITKEGKTASGQPCTATVEKNADGSITAKASSGGGSAGSVSSSSSAGGSSVRVQAGNGSVSSSTTTSGGSGATASAGIVSVNGCTISTTSP